MELPEAKFYMFPKDKMDARIRINLDGSGHYRYDSFHEALSDLEASLLKTTIIINIELTFFLLYVLLLTDAWINKGKVQ